MPFLHRLMEREKYEMRDFYPGIPTTTPAVQAELFYGVKTGVPAFSFRDHETGEMGSLFNSDWAKKFEARFAAQAEGLLKGGSSWSNIYCGGASSEESHFCVASLGFGDLWRHGKIGQFFLFLLLQLPAVIRILFLTLLELGLGLVDAVTGILRGQHPSQELGMVISRMCVGIGLREVVTIGGKVDVTRGLPIIHINFLGYDELSHRRGPDSWFAHWSLRGIDNSIKDLYLAAQRSQRRDYRVWVFSDHGQERTKTFDTLFSGGVSAIIADCLEVSRTKDTAFRSERDYGAWPLSRRFEFRRQQRVRMSLPKTNKEPFLVAAMGPVGHVYFPEPLDDEKKRALARRLTTQGGIPAVLHRASDGSITWHEGEKEFLLPDENLPAFASHSPALRGVINEDLIELCKNRDAGELILLGWDPKEPRSFAPEKGAHAGPGVQETRGFLLIPPGTHLPEGTDDFVRPSALRLAAMSLLGRMPALQSRPAKAPLTDCLRVMSYNVHSCIGMDGRVSPRRIARLIAQQAPDIVALQELDHGRLRSRGENQALLIAEALGYHLAFCPTVLHGQEQYGHAVLSRWPLEIVKNAGLPTLAGGVWPEPRGALLTKVHLGGMGLNILTTHLGLSAQERLLQMAAIMGPEWLEPLLNKEPVIFCGDLNLRPGSPAHAFGRERMQDVVLASRQAIRTFSSTKLMVQLDHIFVSPHLVPERVFTVKNDLTRVASDHLPLIADLRIA